MIESCGLLDVKLIHVYDQGRARSALPTETGMVMTYTYMYTLKDHVYPTTWVKCVRRLIRIPLYLVLLIAHFGQLTTLLVH